MGAIEDPRGCGTRRTGFGPATRVVLAAAAGLVLGGFVAQGPVLADRIRTEQWYLDRLGASAAARYSSGAGVVVAVLDSGVDATHPDLVGQVLPGADFVQGSRTDGRVAPVGHGTTVAALIAGRADDSNGIRGLAPRAKILPVRVLDDDNKYDDATVVANGVRWAVDHGASVINLSLGGAVRSESLANALGYAEAHDVVVVACTGNQGSQVTSSNEVWYPAREPGIIAVAGLTPPTPAPKATVTSGLALRQVGAGGGGDIIWSGSITGPQTVLTAPAVNFTGARPGGYWRVQGTSFAAPLVAAAAALVRSRWPGMNAASVINRLIRSAHDLGPTGRDDQYGFGEVDPAAALTLPIQDVSTNPLVGPATALARGAAAPHSVGKAPRPAATHPRQVPVDNDLLSGSALCVVLLLGAIVFVLRQRHRLRGSHAQRRVLVPSVFDSPRAAVEDASAAVNAKPVCGSSAAAAKMMPSTAPSVPTSGPPEFPLRTHALIV